MQNEANLLIHFFINLKYYMYQVIKTLSKDINSEISEHIVFHINKPSISSSKTKLIQFHHIRKSYQFTWRLLYKNLMGVEDTKYPLRWCQPLLDGLPPLLYPHVDQHVDCSLSFVVCDIAWYCKVHTMSGSLWQF